MDNELYHYGVPKMRWGIRRYQNTDGSLTDAGKRRYGSKENFESIQRAAYSVKKAKIESKAKIKRSKIESRSELQRAKIESRSELQRAKIEAKNNSKIEKYKKKETKDIKDIKDTNDTSSKEKSMSKMSDDELRNKTTRYKLESDYIKEKNNRESLEPKKISKGKSFVNHVGKKVISPALTEGGKRALQNITQAKLQEIFGIRVGKNGPEVVLSRPNNNNNNHGNNGNNNHDNNDDD